MIVIILILVAGLTVSILALTGVFSPNSDNFIRVPDPEPDTAVEPDLNITKPPYIDPKPFHTGYINNLPERQKIADLCNSTMYPIQPIYVDYGTGFSTSVSTPNTRPCDVNIFNSVP